MTIPFCVWRTGCRVLCAQGGLFLFSTAALAQLSTVPLPQGIEPHAGARIGDFVVGARAEAALFPTSNIRLSPDDMYDLKRILAVSANADAAWEKHNLAASVDLFAQDAKDSRNDDLDNHSVSGSLNSRFDIGRNFILRGAVQRQESIVGTGHVDQLNGFVHGTTASTMLRYGTEWDNQTWFVSAMAQYVDVLNNSQYQNVDDVMQESLDRTERQVTLQAGRRHSWGNVYAFIGDQSLDYVASDSLQMPIRDSDGARAGAGMEMSRGNWRGAVSAIAFSQDFATTKISDLSAAVGTIQLSYRVSDTLSLSGLLQRNFAETNIEGSAGIFTDTYFAGLMYAPAPRFYFKLGPAYNRSLLADSSIGTKRVSWEWDSAWQFHPRAAVAFSATFVDQRVTDPSMLSQQYDESSAKLSLVLTY